MKRKIIDKDFKSPSENCEIIILEMIRFILNLILGGIIGIILYTKYWV